MFKHLRLCRSYFIRLIHFMFSEIELRRVNDKETNYIRAFSFEAGNFWPAEMARIALVCASHVRPT